MSRQVKWSVCVLVAWLSVSFCMAIGPHELLVVANGRSADSVQVAKEYMRMRSIPDGNLVRLQLPSDWTRETLTMTPEEFDRVIWRPVTRISKERGIDRHILAWAYSVDFPVTVETPHPVSITGATFVRGTYPKPEDVRYGRYRSGLFIGPDKPDASGSFPQTLDSYLKWLGDEMPMPSMLLGYAGPNGNSISEILTCLHHGVDAGRQPISGKIYLVVGDDIRARARAWQFQGAADELRSKGIAVQVSTNLPSATVRVAGVMAGAPLISPVGRFEAGAICDHLTSYGAAFADSGQTKLTAWIKAGATASAGTVVEPHLIWHKFPHAHMYVAQAAGCSVIESIYQGLACPLQVLPVGEPLASPWGGSMPVSLVIEDDGQSSGKLVASVKAPGASAGGKNEFFLDGRPVGKGPQLELDVGTYNGKHRLRVVRKSRGFVKTQGFDEVEIDMGHDR